MELQEKLKKYAERKAEEEVRSWHYEQNPPEEMQMHKVREGYQAGFAAAVELLGGAVEAVEKAKDANRIMPDDQPRFSKQDLVGIAFIALAAIERKLEEK